MPFHFAQPTSREIHCTLRALLPASDPKAVNVRIFSLPALPNGSQTLSLTLPYAPSSASIHPIMQDRFVTGSTTDEWVRIHSLDGTERDVLKGHHGPVHCVEFSPDGEMFASGSGESSPVWLFARDAQVLTVENPFYADVTS